MTIKKLTNHDDTYTGSNRDDVIYGLGGNDSIFGADGDDEIHGGDGNDIIRAGTGDDKMFGDAGTDIMTMYTGSERCNGGAGVDFIDFYWATKSLNVKLADHKARYAVDGHVGHVSFTDVEGVYGSAQDDTIVGDGKGNLLRGVMGDDKLSGQGGDDFIGGGGNGIRDRDGNDVMTGGSGKDMFIFAAKPDERRNFDRVTDFGDGGDRIGLSDTEFDVHGQGKSQHYGNLGYQRLEDAEFQAGDGHAANGEDVRVIYDRSNGILYYDKNGSEAGGLSEVADIGKHLDLSADSIFTVFAFP